MLSMITVLLYPVNMQAPAPHTRPDITASASLAMRDPPVSSTSMNVGGHLGCARMGAPVWTHREVTGKVTKVYH